MPKVTHRPAGAVAPVALSVEDTMRAAGLSRQTIYDEINAGRLRSFKVGHRRLISPAALAQWVSDAEARTMEAA